MTVRINVREQSLSIVDGEGMGREGIGVEGGMEEFSVHQNCFQHERYLLC